MSKRFGLIAIGFTLVLLVTAIRAVDPFPTQVLRSLYFDTLQQMAPRADADLPVRVVDIDEASLAAVGQWPWPRTELANLVTALDDYGAAVIAFDVIFAEPDRLSPSRVLENPAIGALVRDAVEPDDIARFDNDLVFAEAIANANVVLGIAENRAETATQPYDKAGFVEIGQAPSAGLFGYQATTALVDPLRDAAIGLGGMNVSPAGQTNVVRTVPLLWRTDDGIVPSLSVEALRVALGESTYVVGGTQDLKGVTEYLRLGQFSVPTTDDGEIWVRYRPNDSDMYVSAKDVLDGDRSVELQQALQGHIVLVGASAAGLLDIRATPLGENVPGVSIHAQIIEQILQGDFLHRSDLIAGLEVLAFVFLGILVTLVLAYRSAVMAVMAGALAAITLVAGSFYAFVAHGILFDITFPVIGGAANFGALTAYQFIAVDHEKRTIRNLFSHYVSPGVLKKMEDDDYAVELGGETRAVTIMFIDVRNFTALSENMEPSELVTLLNRLFSTLTAAILDQQGTIDKFMGDAIMAFWNAPLALPDHERRACLAMLEMRAALQRFNASPQMADQKPIATGMGCATGMACVGNIGSTDRFNYSAIGDTVNVASRVETACRSIDYDIVVLSATAEKAGDLAALHAGQIEVKGKSARLPVDILVGDADVAETEAFQQLKSRHAALLAKLVAVGVCDETETLITQ
ncbi:MAG: adenylate/guanylate cyclase domain-containing protein, partial [Pseudomonadota bacterium]